MSCGEITSRGVRTTGCNDLVTKFEAGPQDERSQGDLWNE